MVHVVEAGFWMVISTYLSIINIDCSFVTQIVIIILNFITILNTCNCTPFSDAIYEVNALSLTKAGAMHGVAL